MTRIFLDAQRQIEWFYRLPDGNVCIVTKGLEWNCSQDTFTSEQIHGLDTIPEREANYPQARKLWRVLAPDRCPRCFGYGTDPEIGTCPQCNPRCLKCKKRFSGMYQDGRICKDCSRPTA